MSAGEDTLERFLSTSPIAIACINRDCCVVKGNEAFHRLMQDKFRNNGSLKLSDICIKKEDSDAHATLTQLIEGKELPMPQNFEMAVHDGENIMVQAYISHMPREDGTELIVQFVDVTEQKNLEIKFAHSQKMQAVGQLAGGVAHDFNNLLTAMIGFCDLLLMRHPAGDQSFADIMQIKQNANRAANLVRQLLAFSRRQTLQPKTLEITDVLAELSNLVRRLIGENIELKMVHGRDLNAVKADQGQLEQVIINLAVNARDAMPDGGTLTIQSSNVTISPSTPLPRTQIAPSEEDSQLPPGDYVLVEVGDTGTGIPKDIVQHIFEPFFSTKEVGSGTGLGLSTVYGIIKQTGGYIYVTSKEGSGTTFHIYFPASQMQVEPVTEMAETVAQNQSMDLTGGSTILLVEDETPVRIFAARALRNKGYTVLEADCGETALEVMGGPEGKEVELIISDVIMPGMNGPTMVEQVLESHPDLKVIFISGYAEDVFVHSFGTERSFNFLAKPFTLKQLASKVKEVIQSKAAAA